MRHFVALVALIPAFFSASPAAAHPHVFVDSRSVLVIDKARHLNAVKHHWTFDPAFSAFALQGLDANGDGAYSREELAELAQENVESLADFDFFTFADAGNEPITFSDPVDYWLDYDGTQLTLNFTLPVVEPPIVGSDPVVMQVYDPTIFVAFFLDKDKPAVLSRAEPACHLDHIQVGENKLNSTTNFSDDFLAAMTELDNFASQFAEEIRLTCG